MRIVCQRILTVVSLWTLSSTFSFAQQIRISGEAYVDYASDKTGLSEYASSGVLCVIHRPDCGTVGHNGKEHFFSKDHPLPPGVTIERVDYLPFWPIGLTTTDRGGIGSEGSYGVDLENPGSNALPVSVHWQNACQSSGSNDWAHLPATYQISFVLSGPQAALDAVSKVNPSVPATVDPGLACLRADTPGPRPGEVAIESLTASWNGQTRKAGQTLVIPVGSQAVISWDVEFCGAGCQIGLEANNGAPPNGWVKNNVTPKNSIKVMPQDTTTTYLMGASDTASRKVNDIESAKVTVQLTNNSGTPCTTCQWYYFQLNSPSGAANSECFTYAAYGTESAAEAEAKAQATNYTVKQITAQQYYAGCSA
jgi:hypothetical protein